MVESRPGDLTRAVVARVETVLGPRNGWDAWPGGWPGDIESALIDAIFSARAVYKSANCLGVHAHVVRWRAGRPGSEWTLGRLRDEIQAASPAHWAVDQFGNSQHSPGRPPTAPGGPLKAATVMEAAERLMALGVFAASDITPANTAEVKHALRHVPGVGYATTNYFLMLLGRPGVKPDRMVHRFISDATGIAQMSNRDADRTVREAAGHIGVEPHELEHAIWKWQSDQARTL